MAAIWKKLLFCKSNSYSVYQSARSLYLSRRLYSEAPEIYDLTTVQQVSTNESIFLEPSEDSAIKELEPEDGSVLAEQEVLEDVSYIGPPLDQRSFNFGTFINESEVLKKLVDLGVDFHTIEQNIHKPHYLLKADFNTDINPYIKFLIDLGVSIDYLGRFFTENPFFFLNSLNDLQVRINYLESKKFMPKFIQQIISRNPKWLNYQTVEVDRRLGFYQREFAMNGFEIRKTVSNFPRFINYSKKLVRENKFEVIDVNEFSLIECKQIFMKAPSAWSAKKEILKSRLEYMLLDMEVPRELIVADPVGLLNRVSRLQSRHLFLKSLGRNQYNPKKPNYVTMKALCLSDDAAFCLNIAKTSVEAYNMFLKTL